MRIDNTNLWDLVISRSELSPDSEMLVDEQGRRLTFMQYRVQAEEMAAGLEDHGIQEGDVVAWELPTWLETVVLAAALSRIGAVQNPIIAIYREREVSFCARQAGAKMLITPGDFRGFDFGEMGKKIQADIPELIHIAVGPANFPSGSKETLQPYRAPEKDELRWLCYTSGTTADPKGAKHTDASIKYSITKNASCSVCNNVYVLEKKFNCSILRLVITSPFLFGSMNLNAYLLASNIQLINIFDHINLKSKERRKKPWNNKRICSQYSSQRKENERS